MSAPQVSRRSVARGAAWSVPLVAVGVAAPAFAASGAKVRVTAVTVCQCAGGGTKRYALTATFVNSTASPITLNSVVITEASNTIQNQTPLSTVVAPGTSMVTFYFNRQNNAASGTFTVTFTTSPASPTQPYTTPGAISANGDCLNACP